MPPPPIDTSEAENMVAVGGCIVKVAEHHGIMVWLHPDGTVTVETPLDRHYPMIHPNCYAPADLTQVYLMHGGGSGTAVFHGHSDRIGSIVMKHGNARDTREVFSLVTIRQELVRRGAKFPEAAEYMRARIPEFVMVYLSPYHVRNRGSEMWTTLRGSVVGSGSILLSPTSPLTSTQRLPANSTSQSRADFRRIRRDSLSKFQDVRGSRNISILPSPRGDDFAFDVSFKSVELFVPGLCQDGSISDGVETLQKIGFRLARAQDVNGWKVTLAQKQIGGENAENGAHILTSGKLNGELLDRLVDEFTQVMRDLQQLTLPEERERASLESVRKEIAALRERPDPTQVSKELDSFVGSAIVKNYKPGTGRFAKLREIGGHFRSVSTNPDFFLADDEELPAKLLGSILEVGANPFKFFTDPPSRHFALDAMEGRWLEILEHAASLDSPSTTDRIWTCGLTDAGLHNTFLSNERGLELFDLGEPKLVPQPAFLTKFLMSFFHTLGMEDKDEKSSSGEWVHRFHVVGGDRLTLTDETKRKIPYIYEAYKTASEHFIKDIFDGDQRVRPLLVKYVVLQLLSDASFCLEKWEIKGGGTERYGDRVYVSIAKWLWRSLWDLFMASHVYATLLDRVELPNETRKKPLEHAKSWWDEVIAGSLHHVTSRLALGRSSASN